jgi:hypothetical protein
MGEAKLKQSATQKFISQFPACSLCGGLRSSATREHMPPISLFDGSHRPDDLVMPACRTCNKGTSTADLIVAMISRWGMDEESAQEREDHARLAKRIKRANPEIVKEWLDHSPTDELKARQHLLRHGVAIPPNAEIASVGPATVAQLNMFAHKAVLALYFHHFRQPLPNDGSVFATWRTKEDFHSGIPQVLLDLLPGYGTLQQGKWSERETFEYRHASNHEEGVFGCLARFRRGFYVYGFAVADDALLAGKASEMSWIRPCQLLNVPQLLSRRG